MCTFTNTMRFIGDFDDEFYDDERQRDVWNEAAAVGMQMFIWASLIAGAILPWIAGVAGSWTALGIVLIFLVVSNSVLAYARSRGVDMQTSQKLLRSRIVLAACLYLLALLGAVANLMFDLAGSGPLLTIGMVAGTVVGATAGYVGIARKRRLAREDDRAAELRSFEEEESRS